MNLRWLPLLFLITVAVPSLTGRAEVLWLEKNYDFGLMKEEAGPKEGKARFVNIGDRELVVTDAKPGCGCTSVSYPENPIAPGDTACISFKYDPAGRPGKFEKSIRVYINDKENYRIGISGNVLGTPQSLEQFYPIEIGPLRLSEYMIPAGDIKEGAARNFFINVYNQSADSITPRWNSGNKALAVDISEKKLGPGDIASISLFFNSALVAEPGPVEIPVTLYPDTDSPEERQIIFRANIIPDFSHLSPKQVDKGPRCYTAPPAVDLGIIAREPVPFAFLIENQGKSELLIRKIYIREEIGNKMPAVKISKYPAKIKSGKSATINGTLNPVELPEGPFRQTIEIISNDPIHPVRSLTVVGIVEKEWKE